MQPKVITSLRTIIVHYKKHINLLKIFSILINCYDSELSYVYVFV